MKQAVVVVAVHMTVALYVPSNAGGCNLTAQRQAGDSQGLHADNTY
jgi:hypothetical protein